jgi:hypothetical protein
MAIVLADFPYYRLEELRKDLQKFGGDCETQHHGVEIFYGNISENRQKIDQLLKKKYGYDTRV